MTTENNTKTIYFTIFCLIFTGIPIPLMSIIIGFIDNDNSCLEINNKINLKLDEWLIIVGFVTIILSLLSIILISEHFLKNHSDKLHEYCMVCSMIISLIHFFFNFIFFILGCYKVNKYYSSCITNIELIGIISIFQILFLFLSLLSPFCIAACNKVYSY